jgi:antitoxin component YwqK of YwqJK toxin-antitoxin module
VIQKLPLLTAFAALMMGCGASKEIITVSSENANGRAQRTYLAAEAPANLLNEVLLNAEGDTMSVSSVSKGTLHGEQISFHPNGMRKELVTYVNGELTGPFLVYGNDGVLVFEGMLVSGKKHGTWSMWYDETQKRQECQYVNDLLSGKCTYWYIDGNLQREETYSDGRLIASTDH